MRITQDAKQATRQRILEAASRLLADRGFEQMTTRDLAREAEIASGTLFNYFGSKEDLAITVMLDALDRASVSREAARRPGETLEESLFADVLAQLHGLAPLRASIGEVIETALSPLAARTLDSAADAWRLGQLEDTQRAIFAKRGTEPPALSLQLYWTLYLGVLAFWSADDSPNQEDTLVLLDQSMRLFARTLEHLPGADAEAQHAD